MNVQHSIFEVIEERRLNWFGHLKSLRSNNSKNDTGVEHRGQEEKAEGAGDRDL